MTIDDVDVDDDDRRRRRHHDKLQYFSLYKNEYFALSMDCVDTGIGRTWCMKLIYVYSRLSIIVCYVDVHNDELGRRIECFCLFRIVIQIIIQSVTIVPY